MHTNPHTVHRRAMPALCLLLLAAFPAPLAADDLFAAAVDYDMDQPVLSVAAGDINNDGNIDVIAAGGVAPSSYHFTSMLGSADGTFTVGSDFATGAVPQSIALGFFNDDSNLDVAVACADSNYVSIRMGDGAGGFGSATDYPVGLEPTCVVVGDVDEDTISDLVVANNGDDSISLLTNDGDGTFTQTVIDVDDPYNPDTALGTSDVAIGHVDSDDNIDIIVLLSNTWTLWVMWGDGEGGFTFDDSKYGVGTDPSDIAVFDFNGDALVDVATTEYVVSASVENFDGISVWIAADQRPWSAFNGPDHYTPGTCLSSITAGDFDGDGDMDLAATDEDDGTVVALPGDGTGQFGSATSYAVGSLPGAIVAADFDGNGACDLAVGNAGDDTVSVLLAGSSGTPTEVDLTLTLQPGWNMVSVPLELAEGEDTVAAVFGDDIDAIYEWNASSKQYTVPDAITSDRGYWVATCAVVEITVSGPPVTTWTGSLGAGWNMIGSVYGDAVDTADLSDDPAGAVQDSAIYNWSPTTKSYQPASQIEQGKGYWAASTEACELTMTAPV